MTSRSNASAASRSVMPGASSASTTLTPSSATCSARWRASSSNGLLTTRAVEVEAAVAGHVVDVHVALQHRQHVDGRHHQRGGLAGDDRVGLLRGIDAAGQAGEAADVGDVGRRGGDQRVEPMALQRGPEALGLVRVHQICSSVPVTWPALSAASAATASATAVTGTHVLGSTFGMAARLAGVSIVLGATALTVTPRALTSCDSACMSAITPALATG